MVRYIRKPNFDSDDIQTIQATESVEVSIYDYDENTVITDDDYFEFDSIEEYRTFLKRIGAD